MARYVNEFAFRFNDGNCRIDTLDRMAALVKGGGQAADICRTDAMSALVLENRLYRGDCLEVLKQLDTEGVHPDLIYLAPPFNSNRVYNFVFRGEGEGAEQVAFRDMWNDKHAGQLRFVAQTPEFAELLKRGAHTAR